MIKLFDKKQSKDTIKTQKEQQELLLVNEMHEKFKTAYVQKKDKTEVWNKCIDAYNSDYFVDSSLPDYKSNAISNYIFSTIETIKPIMVDNNPKIIILPKTKNGMETSDKIQDLFDSEWKRAKMGTKLMQAVSLTLQVGTAIWFLPWDADDENGLGNATPKLINPYNFFPDPMATSQENAEYEIYGVYKHINKLKQKYPQFADKLNGSTINYPELVSLAGSQNVGSVTNQVLVLECYLRDYTTIDTEEVDDEGNKFKVKKRKYPNGRVVICAPELGILFEDKSNPYKDTDVFPFVIMKDYDVPFEFWGKSEVEQLVSPQTYINELTNQIIDNAKMTANMPWVLDKNSGIGKGALVNRPGLIIRKNPGTNVERLTPPAMPNYVRETIEILKRDIEIISGIHDVTQGRKPGSVSAASAIIALQEAAQARIRLKVKLMECALQELGHMWYNRIKQYWVTTRSIRTTDKNNKIGFQDVNPEDLDEDYDFLIEAGSTMPLNKNAMLELMIRLSQTQGEDGLPMIDRETVLAFASVPDKQKIVERFAELSGTNKLEEENKMKDAQAMEIAKQQMLQQQQLEAQKQQTMHSTQMNMEQKTHEAQLSQVKNMNSAITDEQIQEVIAIIRQNPEMLQALVPQQNEAQQPMI